MVLIGLENCEGCHIIHGKYPEIPFIEVPRKTEHCDKTMIEVKRALYRHGIDKFPVLMNDDLTVVLPLETINPELAGYHDD